MSRLITSSEEVDYDLTKAFTSLGASYTSTAALNLAAWLRFTAGAPTLLGGSSVTPDYENSPTVTNNSVVGGVVRNTVICESNKNAMLTPAVGSAALSMTSLGVDGGGVEGDALPFLRALGGRTAWELGRKPDQRND